LIASWMTFLHSWKLGNGICAQGLGKLDDQEPQQNAKLIKRKHRYPRDLLLSDQLFIDLQLKILVQRTHKSKLQLIKNPSQKWKDDPQLRVEQVLYMLEIPSLPNPIRTICIFAAFNSSISYAYWPQALYVKANSSQTSNGSPHAPRSPRCRRPPHPEAKKLARP
jgi:hypothetical protein